jgi:hypothetical protein
MNRKIEQKILNCALTPLPAHLEEITLTLSGKTGKTSAGFPYISEDAFEHFQKHVPHLFADGNALLDWLSTLRAQLNLELFQPEELQDIVNSIRVIETVIHTAAVTSVPDCWILKWVLSVWKDLGALELLAKGSVAASALKTCLKAEQRLFENDLSLLVSRGILEVSSDNLVSARLETGKQIVNEVQSISKHLPADVSLAFADILGNKNPQQDSRIAVQRQLQSVPRQSVRCGWFPTLSDIDIGFQVLPVVLGLRYNNQTDQLSVGKKISEVVKDLPVIVKNILRLAAYIDGQDSVTKLGDRVFAKGSGPFGIIHAYHPYMGKLSQLIQGKSSEVWVERGKNVAASQDANRKTFELANQSLERFCKETGFKYSVFIEHAVGQGEATRQRFNKAGGDKIQYFGADLEDAAINAAIEQQKAGALPAQMKFIRNADIGKPSLAIDGVKKAGFTVANAVMMVGNGFHEVRQQTNDAMIQVFREYCTAGIVLIFTEESGLSDADLLATGWNTYHAGFRYVHELSGQGLRPAVDRGDAPDGRFSWGKCATIGGYRVLKRFTSRTRKIFPHPKADGYNPAISVNYFCVPSALVKELGRDGEEALHS